MNKHVPKKFEGFENPKRKAVSFVRHIVWTIEDDAGCPIAEIHRSRWTKGMFSVRLLIGLDTFIMESFDKVKEVNNIHQASKLVDSFLNCEATKLLARKTNYPDDWKHL